MPFLIDTHTHFDVPEYDDNRPAFIDNALTNGICHLVLIGLMASRFDEMIRVKAQIDAYCNDKLPINKMGCHLAMGLHPLYINEHCNDDLITLDTYLKKIPNVAIAEIGLDTYLDELKIPAVFDKQVHFFKTQIELAKLHQLPILLHIRKSHSDALKIIRAMNYKADNNGGIAHAFSGGEQEGLAFVKMGFKIGITGQITNPNAKKLHRMLKAVVNYAGLNAIVIETDCPDMMPVPCQHKGHLNEPANLIFVLDALSELLNTDKETLAKQLWQNSNTALQQAFTMPTV